MARLNKTVVTAREDYVRDLFRQNPKLTGAQVQEKLKEGFGKMMRPNRIYALKAEVLAETPVTSTPEVVETVTVAPEATVTVTSTDTATTATA